MFRCYSSLLHGSIMTDSNERFMLNFCLLPVQMQRPGWVDISVLYNHYSRGRLPIKAFYQTVIIATACMVMCIRILLSIWHPMHVVDISCPFESDEIAERLGSLSKSRNAWSWIYKNFCVWVRYPHIKRGKNLWTIVTLLNLMQDTNPRNTHTHEWVN